MSEFSEKRYLSVKEISTMFNVNKSTVYLWLKYNEIPGKRIGIGRGRWYFDEDEIKKLFHKGNKGK